MKFFRGQKLGVCFSCGNLYSNEFIGYVDLSDFNETWPECSSNINQAISQNSTHFSRDIPLHINN